MSPHRGADCALPRHRRILVAEGISGQDFPHPRRTARRKPPCAERTRLALAGSDERRARQAERRRGGSRRAPRTEGAAARTRAEDRRARQRPGGTARQSRRHPRPERPRLRGVPAAPAQRARTSALSIARHAASKHDQALRPRLRFPFPSHSTSTSRTSSAARDSSPGTTRASGSP